MEQGEEHSGRVVSGGHGAAAQGSPGGTCCCPPGTSSRGGCRCWLGGGHVTVMSSCCGCALAWASHPAASHTPGADPHPKAGSSLALDFPILQSQGLLTFPGCCGAGAWESAGLQVHGQRHTKVIVPARPAGCSPRSGAQTMPGSEQSCGWAVTAARGPARQRRQLPLPGPPGLRLWSQLCLSGWNGSQASEL